MFTAFFKDLARVAAAVLLVLLLFEVGLRLAGAKYESSFYTSDPVLYMALRPGAEGWEAKEGENFIRINSLGMRDRERTVNRPHGVIRVALLGDSLVAAEEVPLENTIGQVLEAKLQAAIGPSHPVEVLNFGVGGYTLGQEFLALQSRVWAFHPDIVVLVLSPSSVASCDRRLYHANVPYFLLRDGKIIPDPKNHPPAASRLDSQRRHQQFGDLMNQIRLLQMIRKATQDGVPAEIAKLEGKKRSLHNDNFLDMWLHTPATEVQQSAWAIAEGILKTMANDAQQHQAEFWISAVGPPIEENPSTLERDTFLQKHKASEFSYAERRFESLAGTNRIRYVALEPALSDFAARNNISLRGFFNTPPDYGHWNVSGNAAAASFLAEELLRESAQLNTNLRLTSGPVAETQDAGKNLVAPSF